MTDDELFPPPGDLSEGVGQVPDHGVEPTSYPNLGGSRSDWEVGLTAGLVFFLLAVFAMQMFLIRKSSVRWTADQITQFFSITLIIGAALMLIVAGYSDEQAAPVYGLLGVIAGYLFGRTSARDDG